MENTTNSPAQTQNTTNTHQPPPPMAAQPIPDEGLPADLTNLAPKFFDGTLIGLPAGWKFEHRPRTNPKYLGKVDQFYYEPGTRRQFRSFKLVNEYLDKIATTEAIIREPRSSIQPPDGTPLNSNIEKKKKKNKRKRNVSFDFDNPPSSVTWCFVKASQDLWLPKVDNPKKRRKQWTQILDGTLTVSCNSSEVSSASTSGSQEMEEQTSNGDLNK